MDGQICSCLQVKLDFTLGFLVLQDKIQNYSCQSRLSFNERKVAASKSLLDAMCPVIG